MKHRERLKKIHPTYRRCPVECKEEGINLKRREKCEDCPLLDEEETFKNHTLEGWQAALGKHHGFDFEQVLPKFYQIISLQEIPRSEMTVRTQSLVGVFLSEKHILEDERDFKK